jgi:hypothetical protein
MTSRLVILIILAAATSPVAAQGASELSTADSAAVVRGAARAALTRRTDARPICITHIADSLATHAGRSFIAEGHAVAGAMRGPDDSAASLAVTLVALSGRDTARVVLRLDGDDGRFSHAFWMNRIEYDFIKDSSSRSWRLIAHRGLYFADYVRDDSSRAPPQSCINGRR